METKASKTLQIRMLLALAFSFFLCSTANAVPLKVELNALSVGTTTSGVAILDFIDGDGLTGSTALISNLSTNPSIIEGSVTQTSLGEYLFTDDNLMSSVYFDLSDIYSGFSFNVDANLADPGAFGFPDALVLSLTDSSGSPLFSTSDPRGSNALFVLSFYGQEVYPPVEFSINTTSRDADPVPEPTTFLLLATGLFTLIVKRKKMTQMFVVLLLVVVCSPAHAALMDVTNQVAISRAPLVYNRTTRTYDSIVKVTNNGTNFLNSPMYLVISGMPDSVSVNNATNLSPDGKPMLSFPASAGGLAPGQNISNFSIKFYNPNNLKFTAVFKVMSDSGELPPDPGDAGKSSLSGIDSNNNGIRDDIEIYIVVNFGNSDKTKEGLNQFALSTQKGVLANTEEDSMLAASASSRAMECLKYLDPNSTSWKSVQSQTVNTPERFTAWMAHEARLSGKVFPARPQREWKSSCSFDPDALAN